jgi:hypothetical protein
MCVKTIACKLARQVLRQIVIVLFAERRRYCYIDAVTWGSGWRDQGTLGGGVPVRASKGARTVQSSGASVQHVCATPGGINTTEQSNQAATTHQWPHQSMTVE